MATQLNGVSRGIILIVLVALVAALGVLQAQYVGTVTSALLIAVIFAGAFAAYEQYLKTKGNLGPTIPLTTIATIVLTVLLSYYPSILGASTWGAKIGIAIGAILLIEQEISGQNIPLSVMDKVVADSLAKE